jgi:hypothetical protein
LRTYGNRVSSALQECDTEGKTGTEANWRNKTSINEIVLLLEHTCPSPKLSRQFASVPAFSQFFLFFLLTYFADMVQSAL